MITFDYKLIRNEGDEIRTFVPGGISKELDNLVYIEGPNSSGKSTLLHILAIGLHGVKNKEIPKSLRKKMESLLDTDYQKLTFNFSINLNNKELISEKVSGDKNEIKLYEKVNGKKTLLTPELFQRKYNLIYDIPIDPTARLTQMTRDIQIAQFRYGNQIGELKAYVIQLLRDIKQSRDPQHIDELKEKISNIEKQIEINKKSIANLNDELNYLETYVYVKYYHIYKNELEEIQREIKKEGKEVKQQDKKKKTVSSQFNTKMLQLKQAISSLKDKKFEITNLLRSVLDERESNHLHVWERIDLDNAIVDLAFDDSFDGTMTHFRRILKSHIGSDIDETIVKEAHLYKYLLSVLNEFSDLDIELPGGKNISQFIKDLLDQKRKYDHILVKSDNIRQTMELLDELYDMKKSIENNFLVELRKIQKDQPKDHDSYYTNRLHEEKLDGLKQDEKQLKRKFNFYEKGWINKGKLTWDDIQSTKSFWKKYTNYTEDQLREEIHLYEDDIVNKSSKGDSKSDELKRNSYQLSMVEDKKEHPYREYFDDLVKMQQIVEVLDQKINAQFKEYINKIVDETAEHTDDEEKENYYSAIFRYLGQKIGYIRHISDEFEVNYIDLIDQKIITYGEKETDHIIRFQDMGTGQGQCAYLLGKLDSSDNRELIALFDEIAMMTTETLRPIYDRFKDLHKKEELLAAIVVQRGDFMNIKPIE
jgi:DNA repair protein SbcC/Rad50